MTPKYPQPEYDEEGNIINWPHSEIPLTVQPNELDDKIKTWPLYEWSFTPPWTNDEMMNLNREELQRLADERFQGDNKALIEHLLGKKDDDVK